MTTNRSKIFHELSLTGLNILACRKPQHLNWWDSITDEVTLGALPLTKNHYREIIKENMVVLSVVEKIELKGIGILGDPVTECDWKRGDITQLILPVMDTEAPSQEQIREGIEFMEKYINEGKKIYVHCKAGKGRSPVLVICYLMHHKKMKYDDDPMKRFPQRL